MCGAKSYLGAAPPAAPAAAGRAAGLPPAAGALTTLPGWLAKSGPWTVAASAMGTFCALGSALGDRPTPSCVGAAMGPPGAPAAAMLDPHMLQNRASSVFLAPQA